MREIENYSVNRSYLFWACFLPMDIRSGALITRMGRPTESKSKTISLMAKSSFSWAINWIIFTKIFKGVSLGTTALEPVKKIFTVLKYHRNFFSMYTITHLWEIANLR